MLGIPSVTKSEKKSIQRRKARGPRIGWKTPGCERLAAESTNNKRGVQRGNCHHVAQNEKGETNFPNSWTRLPQSMIRKTEKRGAARFEGN